MKKSFMLLTIVVSLCFVGCSHNLRITNLDSFYSPPSPPFKETLKMGVTSSSNTDIQGGRYIDAIVDSLRKTGNFDKLIYPYDQSVHRGQVDVVSDITVVPRYSGEGLNFLVNWPGFLIFAPAAFGYGYIAELETNVNITRLKDSASQQISIPTKYEFRQAEIDRTWTEIGWLEFGVIPLIGGLVFTEYDTDVTDEFIGKVSPNYGTYVAKKILKVCGELKE